MHNTKSDIQIQGLNVYYGPAHALQDISLELGDGVLAVVGRNGMGKSTLCKAITGMVPALGSIKFNGQELIGLAPNEITHKGIAYVPQGRRVWRSLTVDETLQLSAKTARQGAWTLERVYQAFPRLAERKNNGGAQLSGGEQQMLAIGRALLFNPSLLVMDEPTEGLAPVIVEQVATLLKRLVEERTMSVLLIEQNLGVALEVADRISVMVNGRISTTLPASKLAADRTLQQRLLGVSSESSSLESETEKDINKNYKVQVLVRQHGVSTNTEDPPRVSSWSASVEGASSLSENFHLDIRPLASFEADTNFQKSSCTLKKFMNIGRSAYVVGAFDTKGSELAYVRQCLERLGLRVVSVDLSTGDSNASKFGVANVSSIDVAQYHPEGAKAVFTNDKCKSTLEMTKAFDVFIQTRDDLGGFVVVGGKSMTAVASSAIDHLANELPKVFVFTGSPCEFDSNKMREDIFLMTVSNGNKQQTLGNAASALSGMMKAGKRLGSMI
jgi:ABC-type branched-subunit amino acid transport system ATPase component